jgi:hypothetical protein
MYKYQPSKQATPFGSVPTRCTQPGAQIIMALATLLFGAGLANASVPVIGGPTYNTDNGTGYMTSAMSFEPLLVNDSGLSLGVLDKRLWPSSLGFRTMWWNASTPATELPNLGTDPFGGTDVSVDGAGLNNAGIAVGSAQKYDGVGAYVGVAAVQWHVLTNSLIEMPQRAPGVFDRPEAINALGVSVGGRSRWNAAGNSVMTLEALPADITGINTWAVAINDSGTAVGLGHDFSVDYFANERPLRWDASGKVTVLDTLGLSAEGTTQSRVRTINNAGTAIGFSLKYDAQHVERGSVAVRWDPNSIAATELGSLGVNELGQASCNAYAINTIGTIVGTADEYDAAGKFLGLRAVRWDSGSTIATALEVLSADGDGFDAADALDINDNGLIVGQTRRFFNNNDFDYRAVYWDTAGHIVDLNSLIDPTGGWVLVSAHSVSNTGWIAGIGMFDPDGPGGRYAYARFFSLQVPEPAALSAIICAAGLLIRRWRRQ